MTVLQICVLTQHFMKVSSMIDAKNPAMPMLTKGINNTINGPFLGVLNSIFVSGASETPKVKLPHSELW